jgi:hypothetical protein
VGRGETLSRRNREKRRIEQPPPEPKILFSLPTVRLLKDALCFLEGVLLSEPEKQPNLPFAIEVVGNLKVKLSEMLEREEWTEETPLDYNEVLILYTAVHMYLIDLQLSRKYDVITPCLELCKKFSVLVEQVNKDVIPQKRKR